MPTFPFPLLILKIATHVEVFLRMNMKKGVLLLNIIITFMVDFIYLIDECCTDAGQIDFVWNEVETFGAGLGRCFEATVTTTGYV